MDQKSWLWPRKRSSEKTIVSISKSDHPAQVNGVEGQTVPNEKEIFLEQSLKILDERLVTALSESNSKDEQLIRSAEMEQEAIAGQKKAEAEVLRLKKELDEAVHQREAANESIMHLNTALRDHIQQLTSLREEQEQKVRDAVMRTSKEFEKANKKLEDRLAETSKRITNLTRENSHLNKVLLVKGKIVEDLTKSSAQAEAEFNALMSRLDSVEKENSFLRYEFQMLEREFHIRNEEMEFSRRSLDASHKQQLENVKKIRKLEAECQRLRLLSRKRLPGQVALTKVKNEIEMQEKSQTVVRRRKSDPPTGSLILKDTAKDDFRHKEITFLVERMCNLEGENKALKDLLGRKEVEICHSSVKGSKELALASPLSNETSSISSYDTCKRDESICSKMIGVSEMCLMDDFAEMEKLAIVAVDSTIGSSYPPSDASPALSDSSRIEIHGHQIDSTGKELVKVGQHDLYDLGMEVQGQDSLSKRSSNWLHEILKIIMEQSHVSKKGTDELIEDIRVALYNVNPPCTGPSELLPISGYITWKSPVTSPKMHSLTIEPGSTQSVISELEKIHSILQAENERLKAEINSMKSSNKDVQVKLQVVKNKSENLASELKQSQQSIVSLRAELEEAKESKRMMEDLLENQKSINEDLDTQLTVTKVKLNETLQKLSSLEVELEDRSHCCEELEGTCLELQLQLESITDKRTSVDNVDQEKGLHQTGWEITSASAKLAECQETILNLGKQIKALSLPKENTVGATNGSIKNMRKHMSLLDQMLSEDDVQKEELNSPNLEEPLRTMDTVHAAQSPHESEAKTPNVGTMVILPAKKRGGVNFLRKLLLRKKRERSKKRAFPLGIETY
ncbi:filament-like plant protein 7 isoform X1 [Nicotiana tomentosiformis]|uniref:filament-like plant protein 7 isoform X1 n=1 Tax=Nicotiana tomentosiformis TaxID=4098 RepID=UPI00051B1512|nr:filament-like plant protein 7 isoform X1 [Nicotiana tomentosiformis]XP_009588164.1 filament-like plant protein 7 isoform X1 [Nicotiana tomentosiformis]XP_009588169.1 filament-like plant protein 7 isoform X1 [Nicotiana tomentosiformis]XP_009588176.1 filament-like plant protein 7 isoform X1 [Nicotiana tomentosiformis]XP_033509208.1 filament-like plant protein 7 isoform X1 [Nicotiana tomentosiformis]